MKNALKSRACGVDWAEHLPKVMLGIRAAPKEDSAVAAAEMVYGSPLTLPGQLLTAEDMPADNTQQRVETAVEKFSAATRTYADAVQAVPRKLGEVELVYVRQDAVKPPLTPSYSGPFKVIERSPKFFRLKIGDREEVVSPRTASSHTLGQRPLSRQSRRTGGGHL